MGTGTINSLKRRLESLKLKHKKLDKQIEEAYSNHMDDLKLHDMKKQKLSLKEELYRLETEIQGC